MAELLRSPKVRILSYVSGVLANNAYIVVCEASGESVVIDSPPQPSEMLSAAQQTTPRALLITHGHWDHTEGCAEAVDRLDVPVWLGTADRHVLKNVRGLKWLEVSAGGEFAFGELILELLPTPGHTPGSTCFYLSSATTGEKPYLFSGDTLFPGGPGRTASHQDFKTILESIRHKLLPLPGNTAILPGHGAHTRMEQVHDEFNAFISKPLTGTECGDVVWQRRK